ncbi:Protein of unknown function [Pseudomonas graminis]|uniref:DUF1654 domain-containing protein n=2 Tax=Pseudomonas graminis TaxID=158627 RepID=A0A1I0JIN0_9PSED|nr:Protein of unknown function [Pseudomonas graminis]
MYSSVLPFHDGSNTVYPYSIAMEDDMTPSTANITFSPTPYEQVGRRIQRLVSDPKVQKRQAVDITRREDETPEAWEQVLQELDETDGITVERLQPGYVRIGWKRYIDL